MFYQFPKSFWWGTASSAPQSEGASDKRAKITWDQFYEEDPIRFFDEVGPSKTCDTYYRYREDFKIMKEIGLNTYRTSISWARLFPQEGQLNQEAVQFYHNFIDEMINNGITPFINLFHFDTPMYLQNRGGWESKNTIERYIEFAKTCFELYGDKVKYWFTFNEPVPIIDGGYLDDRHYPNVVDFKRAIQVGYNVHVAHAKAVLTYKENNYDGKIGLIHVLSAVYPRSQNPSDLRAAMVYDLFYNRSFLDPIFKGTFPIELIEIIKSQEALPDCSPEENKCIQDAKIDIFGLNFYYPKRIKAKECIPNPEAPFKPSHLYDYYTEMKGIKLNPYRGWEIYEKGLYDLACRMKNEYGNIPWFVAENGMGVENERRFKDSTLVIQDEYRINFLKSHLKWLHKAIQEGCNCLGFHWWTFIDNWSWINAYKNRYGLVELDRENNLQRRIKKSGYWFKKMIEQNGFKE
ncbi:MAG: glycoside hydrolase family 1 protein [Brevinema sp.]